MILIFIILMQSSLLAAEQEYDIFNKTQKIDSDFDKEVQGLLGSK